MTVPNFKPMSNSTERRLKLARSLWCVLVSDFYSFEFQSDLHKQFVIYRRIVKAISSFEKNIKKCRNAKNELLNSINVGDLISSIWTFRTKLKLSPEKKSSTTNERQEAIIKELD
jgi:hypothetical protein